MRESHNFTQVSDDCRGVLRTQSSINDGTLLRKQLSTKVSAFSKKLFSKKNPSPIFGRVLNTPLIFKLKQVTESDIYKFLKNIDDQIYKHMQNPS